MSTSRRSEHLRYRTGICFNENCEKCRTKEVQQISARKDFVCAECGKPLHECRPPKKSKVSPIKIGIIVLVVVACAVGVYFLFFKKTAPKDIRITLNHDSLTMSVGERDTLITEVYPPDFDCEYVWKSSDKNVAEVEDGVVTAVKEGEATITIMLLSGKETQSVTCEYRIVDNHVADSLQSDAKADTLGTDTTQEVLEENSATKETESVEAAKDDESDHTGHHKPIPASKSTAVSGSGVNLGYGVYQGDVVGGKPHGQGKLVYNKRTVISSYDPKKRTAEAGEYVQGQFVNGYPTIVKHYDAGGHLIETLNLGVD